MASERTIKTYGVHAKGAFLDSVRPLQPSLPIKTKGNCKEKRKSMKKVYYDENKWAKLRLFPTGFSVVEQPIVHYV